ncbi:MAG: sigma-70 family RNA polymerase sigma factor [Anaerolineales bacterium]|uniref:RNA polymerase sigma factor n=1 Tax=Candidatus Villigracilis proximus TaxID=3140683 RepID=UPI003135D162|nr:sigma-70 family RNA polymerase sigma factor [Anaerolineales bacterium]
MDHYRRETSTEELTDNLPNTEDTENATEHNLSQNRVREALHKLTEDQQQVIALKFLEGWENEDIARVLNKPVGAVKSLQHRALARLQKTLLEDEV